MFYSNLLSLIRAEWRQYDIFLCFVRPPSFLLFSSLVTNPQQKVISLSLSIHPSLPILSLLFPQTIWGGGRVLLQRNNTPSLDLVESVGHSHRVWVTWDKYCEIKKPFFSQINNLQNSAVLFYRYLQTVIFLTHWKI